MCAGIRDSAQEILVESKLLKPFSEFVPAENLNQMALDFELDPNRARTKPLAIVTTAITFGVIGFTVPSGDWNLTATYTPANRSAIGRQYHGSTYRSIGLISLTSPPSGSRQVGGLTSFHTVDSEVREVVRDLVLNFLRDLQQSGEL
jgi:hypothetical protein